MFLAVQNSSIGDLVTNSLTQSVSNVYFCHTKRLATIETFDQSDENFLMTFFDDNFQIFGQILDFFQIFLKKFRYLENCQFFGKNQIF